MPDSPDKPFGIAGQLLGLRVREPKFEEGEEVRWEARANHFQQRMRSVGGRIYLTDQRLVFAPTKFEERIAGRAWSARLGSLDRAFVHGLMKLVHVVANDGEKQRFVIGSRVESAVTINDAIQTAKASALDGGRHIDL